MQAAVEKHLREHPDKHVRDWASKTSPPPPPPRKIDPVKAAARAKVREEKQAAKDKEKTARAAATAEKTATRAAVKETRTKAAAEKRTAREEKKTAQVAALKKLGAPVTRDGKIDASKVPGASKDFKPPTSADPENSIRGRSFVSRSAKEMKSEFLGAVGRGGDNESILLQQLGHLGVRDPVQWEAINEKYETKATTFDEAFAVLAKASGKGTPSRRPDWRNLDIGALQECAGLEGIQLPEWMNEAQATEQERDHYLASSQNEDEPGSDSDEEHDGEAQPRRPPHDDEEAPF